VETGIYKIPHGKGDGTSVVLDIRSVVEKEARLAELAWVNPHTATELFSTFNRAWLDTEKTLATLTYHHALAKKNLTLVRGETFLNCTEAAVKARGHKPSADIRKAMVDVDPAVLEAQDRLDRIDAVIAYVKSKQTAFASACSGIKALVRSGSATPTNLHALSDRPASTPAAAGPDPRSVTKAANDLASAMKQSAEENDEDLPLPPGFASVTVR